VYLPETVTNIKSREICIKDFREAMERVRPTITPEIERNYEEFGRQYGKRLAEEVSSIYR
jgi:hypothetical protein